MIGTLLTYAAVVALIGLGAGAWLAPARSAQGYGVPTTESTALTYVRATGARDVVFGLIVAVLGIAGARPLLAATFAVLTLVAVADFVVVSGARKPHVPRAAIVHGIGIVALPIVAVIVGAGW